MSVGADERAVAVGQTIFCDDIRLEVDGKLTLVGVYPNVMYVHADFPVHIAKFALARMYSERIAAEPPQSV